MTNFGSVPIGSVLPVFFGSYAAATGASASLTGLAATDIEIYKGTSMTQRASDAGYTLLDTDGIDVDGTTGINAFSIDTGDNTDSGFFAAGSFYTVVVSAVTIDGQTVNFVAASFRLVAAESVAGTPRADVSHAAGTAWASGAITAASIASDAITDAKVASDVTIASVTGSVGSVTGAVGSVTGNVGGNVVGSVGSVTGAVGSVTGNVGGNVTGSVGSIAAGGITEASFATTAGSFAPLGIIDQGTAQSATASSLVIRAAAAFGDNTLTGSAAAVLGSDQGYWQALTIASNVGSTDTLTLNGTFPVTPTGTLTYKLFMVPAADDTAAQIKAVTDKLNTMLELTAASPGEWEFTADSLRNAPSGPGGGGGGGLDEAGVRAAIGLASANLDAQLAAIVADTNELQTDWADGGRLDLILDGRASQSSVDTIDGIVDSILLDTAEIGAAGAGLTALPWNAAWDAEVQSECTDALNAYDPPTRAELTTDTNSILTAVGDVPTNAELATALASADDAVLAAVGALSIPTATENADALLNRDMSAVSDTNARSPLNALRFLRNKWSISGTTLTVTKENDSTTAWTAVVETTPGADPVTGNDPA